MDSTMKYKVYVIAFLAYWYNGYPAQRCYPEFLNQIIGYRCFSGTTSTFVNDFDDIIVQFFCRPS